MGWNHGLTAGETISGDLFITGQLGINLATDVVGLTVEASGSQTANLLEVNTNGGSGGDLVVVTSAGSVGVGNGTPTRKLDLSGTGFAQFRMTGETANQAAGIEVFNDTGEFGKIEVLGSTFATVNLRNEFLVYSENDLVFGTSGRVERARFDINGNLGLGTDVFGTSAAGVLAIANGTQGAALADAVQLISEDLSAGNTILSIRTEGSGAVATGTPAAADGAIALKVNGTVRYLTYSDTAPT